MRPALGRCEGRYRGRGELKDGAAACHGGEIGEKFFAVPQAPAGVRCWNPAFDVTPGELITAIITEQGIFRPPYRFDK